MRKPNRASLTPDAALLLSYDIGLVIRHGRDSDAETRTHRSTGIPTAGSVLGSV